MNKRKKIIIYSVPVHVGPEYPSAHLHFFGVPSQTVFASLLVQFVVSVHCTPITAETKRIVFKCDIHFALLMVSVIFQAKLIFHAQ